MLAVFLLSGFWFYAKHVSEAETAVLPFAFVKRYWGAPCVRGEALAAKVMQNT